MPLIEAFANTLLAVNGAIRDARSGRRATWTMPVDPGRTDVSVLGEEDGIEVAISYAEAVESNPIAWAVVNKLVRELSTLGVEVVRHKRDGNGVRTGKVERVHGTSLEELLNEPAPGMGLVDLLEWLFMPGLTEGNSLLGKWRPRGAGTTPKGIVPLNWRFMSAFARPGGPVEHWLSTQMGFDEPRELDSSEVVHLAWRPPSGRPLGVSPLHPLAGDIKIDNAAVRYLLASLKNGARPMGALVAPPDAKIGDDDVKKMTEKVNKRHRGVDNAFRIAVLTGGLKWEKMSFSAAEAELDATRARSREHFCVAYDIRWSQIADPPQGSSAVDPGANARDLHRTLRPWGLKGQSALQRQLVDPEPEWRDEDLSIRISFAELLRGTPQEEANRSVHLFTSGIATSQEARPMAGLPEEPPEGQELLVPHAQLKPADGRSLPPSTDPDSERNQVDRGPQPT